MTAVYGPANEHDISRARELIPSETEQVYGDAGYVGMGKREEFQTDKEAEKRSYRINLRPGVLKVLVIKGVQNRNLLLKTVER